SGYHDGHKRQRFFTHSKRGSADGEGDHDRRYQKAFPSRKPSYQTAKSRVKGSCSSHYANAAADHKYKGDYIGSAYHSSENRRKYLPRAYSSAAGFSICAVYNQRAACNLIRNTFKSSRRYQVCKSRRDKYHYHKKRSRVRHFKMFFLYIRGITFHIRLLPILYPARRQ